jgi:hypothetical protein
MNTGSLDLLRKTTRTLSGSLLHVMHVKILLVALLQTAIFTRITRKNPSPIISRLNFATSLLRGAQSATKQSLPNRGTPRPKSCHNLSEVEKSPTYSFNLCHSFRERIIPTVKKFPALGGVPPTAAGWLCLLSISITVDCGLCTVDCQLPLTFYLSPPPFLSTQTAV